MRIGHILRALIELGEKDSVYLDVYKNLMNNLDDFEFEAVTQVLEQQRFTTTAEVKKFIDAQLADMDGDSDE